MRLPTFMNTIRFRLTLWYSILLLLFGALFIIGLNLAMHQALDVARFTEPPSPWTVPEIVRMVADENLMLLRNFSIIGLGALLVLGAIGGYFFSGRMLRPVDNISSLAARISSRNLKERINYQGPDDEVKRLADTFDDMLRRLDEAFESQQQFVQDASHELKTPIATIQTNLEVLDMNENATIEDYKHNNEVVRRSLDRLNTLSQGLLLLSQGSRPEHGWVEVDVPLLIDEAVAEFQPAAASAGVNLEAGNSQQGLKIKGDAMGLKQVIGNLVDNAIKYNRPQGRVQVSARAQDSSAVIEVKDTGVGVADTEQQRIFDRFYRVDKSRSRASGGSGLGLAIVKKIVEEHGGNVSVQSILGEGTTFRVILPRHI